MSSWLRKSLASLFFLGVAAPLTLGAFLWATSQSSSVRVKAESSVAQSTPAEGETLRRGFLSLHQFCQTPPPATPEESSRLVSPSKRCPYWPAPAAIAPESPKAPSPAPLPQWLGFMNNLMAPPSEAVSSAPVPLPPAEELPQLHRQARLARVPIFMYHDILPKKEVFFDVTPQELEAHFQRLKKEGTTPITADWLLAHLRLGVPLPSKPVLLSFDDGYGGHYKYVYPLLKKYNYPALFSVYVKKMEGKTGRTSLTWPQLQEMAADPLVTIASHSVTHPRDLRQLDDDQLAQEVLGSKRVFEERLGRPIHYFTYPEGKLDARVKQWVIAAGYKMALAMDDNAEVFAGDSPDLFTVGRFGQSRLQEIAPQAWGGYPAPVAPGEFNLTSPIEKRNYTREGTELILVSGGRPTTIHADSRYQVVDILKDTGAIAGVDGGFFSLKYLDSNVMIGPVFSSNRGFVPGNASENPRLQNRPLILISSKWVKFVPFDAARHNSLAGIQREAGDGQWIKDAFVGAAWLVKDDQPQPAASFGSLFDYDAHRHRAFWGINQAGQPVIGVTKTMIDSVALGRILHSLGLRDAVMLDSGASTSLSYQGASQVEYTPRPVPHVVALYPTPQR